MHELMLRHWVGPINYFSKVHLWGRIFFAHTVQFFQLLYVKKFHSNIHISRCRRISKSTWTISRFFTLSISYKNKNIHMCICVSCLRWLFVAKWFCVFLHLQFLLLLLLLLSWLFLHSCRLYARLRRCWRLRWVLAAGRCRRRYNGILLCRRLGCLQEISDQIDG